MAEEPASKPAKSAPAPRPLIACTPDELARLRDAFKRGEPDAKPILDLIKRAEESVAKPLEFPPRGGQHNQWYQCDKCQIALKTVDATHHQCPKCERVYSGEPYDDVVFSRVHNANLRRALDNAWAYAITGRAEFAAQARAVLLGYAQRYREYPYHDNARNKGPSGGHLNEQTLGEASMTATMIAPAVDLLLDDAALPPDDRARIDEGLLRPILANIAKHKTGKNNWQTWHNAALFAGAALLGDRPLMRSTIDDPKHGFLYQMRVSVSDEGMWYENSWSYHAYTLSALTLHAEYARRCGVDLWSQPPLRMMFTLPIRYTMPDGSLPRFGDAVGMSSGAAVNDLEAAYHATKDASLLPALSKSPTLQSVMYGRDTATRAEPPALGSEVFPGAGHAVLRSRGPAGLAAVITFGPYGGFHGHFDKLSFVLYGRGRELGVDPGRAASQAYRLPIHTNWYKATISHNAVLVDGQPQEPAEGKLLAFGANDQYAAAVAECDKAYPGVRHRRLLCVGPDYALVIDDLAADKPRRFDWLYHNRGKSVEVSSPGAPATRPDNQPVIKLKNTQGQQYVNWAFRGETAGDARAVFIDDPVRTHVLIAGGEPAQVFAGDGVGASVDDRVPMIAIQREGTRGVFAAVIEPRDDKPSQVESVTVTRDDQEIVTTVTRAGARDQVTLTHKGAAKVRVNNEPALTVGAWKSAD